MSPHLTTTTMLLMSTTITTMFTTSPNLLSMFNAHLPSLTSHPLMCIIGEGTEIGVMINQR